MGGWLSAHAVELVALLLSLDAERRLLFTTDWRLERVGEHSWVLFNDGWLAEHDVRVECSSSVDFAQGCVLKRHESARVGVSRVEGVACSTIRVSSRRILFRHSRVLAL